MKEVLKFSNFRLAAKITAICLVTIASSVALSVGNSNAQSRKAEIAHEPPPGDELAAPGTPITLSATLINSKDSNLEINALLVKDGKAMNVKLRDLTSDLEERLVYSVTIPAPLAELSYQLYLTNKGKIISSTDRYVVRRACLPNISPVDMSAGLGSGKKMDVLKDRAARLQAEVQNYESALTSLETLKAITEKKDAVKSN